MEQDSDSEGGERRIGLAVVILGCDGEVHGGVEEARLVVHEPGEMGIGDGEKGHSRLVDEVDDEDKEAGDDDSDGEDGTEDGNDPDEDAGTVASP